jgi:hypothetical protein
LPAGSAVGFKRRPLRGVMTLSARPARTTAGSGCAWAQACATAGRRRAIYVIRPRRPTPDGPRSGDHRTTTGAAAHHTQRWPRRCARSTPSSPSPRPCFSSPPQVFSQATRDAFPRIRTINWFEWRKEEPEVGRVIDWRISTDADLAPHPARRRPGRLAAVRRRVAARLPDRSRAPCPRCRSSCPGGQLLTARWPKLACGPAFDGRNPRPEQDPRPASAAESSARVLPCAGSSPEGRGS